MRGILIKLLYTAFMFGYFSANILNMSGKFSVIGWTISNMNKSAQVNESPAENPFLPYNPIIFSILVSYFSPSVLKNLMDTSTYSDSWTFSSTSENAFTKSCTVSTTASACAFYIHY